MIFFQFERGIGSEPRVVFINSNKSSQKMESSTREYAMEIKSFKLSIIYSALIFSKVGCTEKLFS